MRISLLVIALFCSLGDTRGQAPEVFDAAEQALMRLYPDMPVAALRTTALLGAAETSALGCALVAGLPLSTALDVYRLEYLIDGSAFALHVSADGSLVQVCDERAPNLGRGTLSLRRATADSDGDGVDDSADACPEIAGLNAGELRGCPLRAVGDRDGDGVGDGDDRCPDQAGAARTEGCALLRDGDGDGVPDHVDICSDDSGIIRSDFALGCPGDGSGSSSRQGVSSETCHVSGDSTPIYASASEQAAIVDRLIPALAQAEFSEVRGRSADGIWARVADGWVRANELRGACYNIPLLSVAPGEATGCFLRPRGEFANVRAGPGGRIVRRIGVGELQAVLGENVSKDWLFFREGWVSRSVLQLSGVCDDLPVLNPAQVGSGTFFFCPPEYVGLLPPRIAIGERNARIASATIANRLRAAPQISAEQIGEIPPGTVIDAVLDGPACNLAFVWWQVEVDGRIGWTVESDRNANYYYLEPAPSAEVADVDVQSLSPRALSDAAPATASRLIHSANANALDTIRAMSVESPRAVAWSPSGLLLAAIAGDGRVALIKLPGFMTLDTSGLSSETGEIRAIAFSPDGRYLALGSGGDRVSVTALSADGTVTMPQALGELAGPVRGLAWSAAGDKLAAISGDEGLKLARRAGTLKLWDVASGSSESSRLQLHYSFPYPLTAVAFSRDGRWLAVSGGSVADNRAALWIYDAESGDLVFSKALIPMPGGGLVSASPDSALGDFVYSSGDSLYQIAVESGDDMRFYHQAGSRLDRLAFRAQVLPGAEALFALTTRDRSGEARLHLVNALNAYSPETVHDIDTVAMAFSPDGTSLAFAERNSDHLLVLAVADS